MQKIKTIQIGQKSFTLKELPMHVVRQLVNRENTGSILDRGQELLQLSCPELTVDSLLELYPSEVEELWHGFEEVNASFLGFARLVGLDRAMIDLVHKVVRTSIGQFASSLPAVMDPGSGSTDIASS
ncbi:hypothetical protein [Desulfobulbus sp.]|uniref:hypothetical protein n=1 Tax=Desulfobulbus sp. TaxID=895 RepID=UPI00286F57D3|nr:hypothetical protein [Desulfobulbus sp.]